MNIEEGDQRAHEKGRDDLIERRKIGGLAVCRFLRDSLSVRASALLCNHKNPVP
jgi:hypothetical protein